MSTETPSTIHIVDDEKCIRDSLSGLISYFFPKVSIKLYEYGKELLDVLDGNGEADIYIVDGTFPMDDGGSRKSIGLEIAQKIHEKFPGVGIIGYSSTPEVFNGEFPTIEKGSDGNILIDWIQQRISQRTEELVIA